MYVITYTDKEFGTGYFVGFCKDEQGNPSTSWQNVDDHFCKHYKTQKGAEKTALRIAATHEHDGFMKIEVKESERRV